MAATKNNNTWAVLLVIVILGWLSWKFTNPPIIAKPITFTKEIKKDINSLPTIQNAESTIYSVPGVSGKIIDPLHTSGAAVPEGMDMFSTVSNAY